jgi:hypothetical protein
MPVTKQATDKLADVAQLLGTARAASAGLTDPRRQTVDLALAAAIDARAKAVVAVEAWKRGDPPPAALHTLRVSIEAALVAVQALSGNPGAVAIANSLLQAIDDVAGSQAALTAA